MKPRLLWLLAALLAACDDVGDAPLDEAPPAAERVEDAPPQAAAEDPPAESEPEPLREDDEEPEQPAVEPTPADLEEGEEVELLPPVEPEAPVEAKRRPRRRMNLDQLGRALRQVSGGIGWTELRGGSEHDLLVELSATLGKPDYVQVVQEDLTPSALFQKFLDDAARSTCARVLERELDAGPALLLQAIEPTETDAEAVRANMEALLLHFHGRAAVDAELASWRWLFDSVVFVTGEPLDAWYVTCVALITHPDFYTY